MCLHRKYMRAAIGGEAVSIKAVLRAALLPWAVVPEVLGVGNNLSATAFVEDRCEFVGRKTGGPGAAPCQGAVFNSSRWSCAAGGALEARALAPQPPLRTFRG